MYIADLELCNYHSGAFEAGNWLVPLRAVGWLEHPPAFSTGSSPSAVISKLKTMVEQVRSEYHTISFVVYTVARFVLPQRCRLPARFGHRKTFLSLVARLSTFPQAASSTTWKHTRTCLRRNFLKQFYSAPIFGQLSIAKRSAPLMAGSSLRSKWIFGPPRAGRDYPACNGYFAYPLRCGSISLNAADDEDRINS